MILPQFWRLEPWNQGVGRALFPLKAPREVPSLPLPAFMVPGDPWRALTCGCITSISASVFTWCFRKRKQPFFPPMCLLYVYTEHFTTDTYGHKACGGFPPPSNSLWYQLGILQFNWTLTSSGNSVRSHRWKDPTHETAPPSSANHRSRWSPVLLTERL